MPGCILPLRSTAGQRTPRGICGGVSIAIDARPNRIAAMPARLEAQATPLNPA
jgi:hypothetical protein